MGSPEETEWIDVKILNDNEEVFKFHVDTNVPIYCLLKMYFAVSKVEESSVKFFYQLKKLPIATKDFDWTTPKSMKMEEGSVIYVKDKDAVVKENEGEVAKKFDFC